MLTTAGPVIGDSMGVTASKPLPLPLLDQTSVNTATQCNHVQDKGNVKNIALKIWRLAILTK